MFDSLVVLLIILFVIYKLLDRLIRIPRIGNYQDRYILVTGCDTGFGNVIAKRLDQLECHVFAGCFTEKGETELKKTCSDRLHVISLDVTKKESVRKALEYVEANLPKGKGLWGILNNAGNVTSLAIPDWLTVEDYRKQCEVNLWGLIDVTMTFLPLVKKAKGRVVNTSSYGGRTCFNLALPYCVSKYGVEVFTDGIRRTIYYFGCKASIVEPGAHRTQIFTLESFISCIEGCWNRADQTLKEDYGGTFEKIVTSTVEKMSDSVSDRLTDVSDAYEHALLARFPRARYVVGADAKYVHIPLHSLPEWLGDWIMRKLDDIGPRPTLGPAK